MREKEKGIPGGSPAEEVHVQHVEAAGAGNYANHQLAENGGNPETAAYRCNDLGSRKQYGDQQRQLQSCGHPLLLGTNKDRCCSV